MKRKSAALFSKPLRQMMLVVNTVLEAILAFWIFVELIDIFFGRAIVNGYEIQGWATALPFLLVIAYLIAMSKYFGGTLAMRLGRWLAKK